MPPRRQNPPRQRAIRDIEMEELRQQIQRLQDRLKAFEGQQARHPQDEPHESKEDTDDENPFHHLRDNESSSSTGKVCRRQCPQQNATPKSTDLGIKIDIPDFEGRLQPDEFIDWLHIVERVFELKDIPDNKRVKLVAIKLKKHASIWRENLKHTKSLTVEEYTMEFEQLMMKWDVREKEEQTIARYLGGLDNDISKVVQLQQYWTLDDVIRLALRVEKQISKKNITITSKPRDFEGSQGTQASKIVAETLAKVEKKASSSRPAQPNTRKCFKCQGFGHIASNCPNRRIITIIGGEIYEVLDGETEKEISDEIKPQLEEELIATDHGESLVFDRKAIHDGHANTYTFVKDGVQIKLTPLKPKDLLEKKDENKTLISRSTSQKLHQESRIACLLLLSKVNDATSPFLEEIRSLLEEFSNVVPDDTPHGLLRTQ
ncbi:hypothetical protein SLEP1_g48406 [Rubroshorea leprosula]|uniref:CCHC-type domain-containing protein n=1 Tax=Rubroshorea leprosula TaxID=152421 RepID=A0AAV5LTH1_9ROSI|nr:hypothetical protein SLEP1_g48406 [Rubroshorea leprosula]